MKQQIIHDFTALKDVSKPDPAYTSSIANEIKKFHLPNWEILHVWIPLRAEPEFPLAIKQAREKLDLPDATA